MSVTIVNRSREAVDRYRDGSRAGLAAAANLLATEVKKAHGSWYYKGGAFRDTLKVKASIRYLTPYQRPTGWETQVGTKIIQALYWELGHTNRWTRNKERVRIWEPTAQQNKDAMRAAYARVVKRVMEAR